MARKAISSLFTCLERPNCGKTCQGKDPRRVRPGRSLYGTVPLLSATISTREVVESPENLPLHTRNLAREERAAITNSRSRMALSPLQDPHNSKGIASVEVARLLLLATKPAVGSIVQMCLSGSFAFFLLVWPTLAAFSRPIQRRLLGSRHRSIGSSFSSGTYIICLQDTVIRSTNSCLSVSRNTVHTKHGRRVLAHVLRANYGLLPAKFGGRYYHRYPSVID